MTRDVLVSGLYLLVALVNALPVVGVISGDRLRAMYGVELSSPDLVLLMRHRAVLFGIVAALLAMASVQPELRVVAAGAGFVSMLSFVGLAGLSGPVGRPLRRVVIIDVAASIVLGVAVSSSCRLAQLEPSEGETTESSTGPVDPSFRQTAQDGHRRHVGVHQCPWSFADRRGPD